MRRRLAALVVAAVVPQAAGAASVDPRDLTLFELDAPARYLFDPSNSAGLSRAALAASQNAAARQLARGGFVGMYVARYMNTDTPRWRFVTSGAYVFRRAAGARSTLVSQFRSTAGGGFGPARRIRLGDEGWVRTSSARDTGTIVFWRHGRVLALVVCSDMTRHRALAEELARKQERRITSRLG
jgi:hypothetical protein